MPFWLDDQVEEASGIAEEEVDDAARNTAAEFMSSASSVSSVVQSATLKDSLSCTTPSSSEGTDV